MKLLLLLLFLLSLSSYHYNSLRPPDRVRHPFPPKEDGCGLCANELGPALQLISLATARLTVTSCVSSSSVTLKSSLQQSLPAFITRKRKLIGYGIAIFSLCLSRPKQTLKSWSQYGNLLCPFVVWWHPKLSTPRINILHVFISDWTAQHSWSNLCLMWRSHIRRINLLSSQHIVIQMQPLFTFKLSRLLSDIYKQRRSATIRIRKKLCSCGTCSTHLFNLISLCLFFRMGLWSHGNVMHYAAFSAWESWKHDAPPVMQHVDTHCKQMCDCKPY